MTVWKIKLSPRWRIAVCVAMLAIFTALCVVSAMGAMTDNEETASGASVKNEQAAADYLRAVGEEDAAQLSCERITIPEQFDEVYEEYNGMQRQSGFDLSEYKGKDSLRFTFALTRHDASYAVLLVRDCAVIGGHYSNGEYGGEYLPLEKDGTTG
ncbi:MAG: DUF4830 domain-containing protein [Ruminococcus sp.]|nr:DUF4830 domain-containing protein [Ruminococcus sp.]